MLRVYFDTQIVTYLQRPLAGKEETYIKLSEILNNENNHLMLFYSIGHLGDYRRDLTDAKDIDLNYMSQIRMDYFINYNIPNRRATILKEKPIIKYYSGRLNEKYDAKTHLGFISSRDKAGYEAHIKSLDNLYKFYSKTLFKFERNRESINKLNSADLEAFNNFRDLLPFSHENLTRDLFDEAYSKLLDIRRDTPSGELNKLGIKMGNHFRSEYTISPDPINFSDHTLKGKFHNTDIERYLVDHMLSRMHYDGNKSFEILDELKFHTGLDWIVGASGIVHEKNSKYKFHNTTSDSFHSFFASFCDILITTDEKLAQRSKVIYGFLCTNTLVLSVEQFVHYYDNTLNSITINESDKIIKKVKEEIKIYLKNRNMINNTNDQVMVDSVYRYLGFFNNIEFNIINNFIAIKLMRLTNNYFNPWTIKEIELLVNNAVGAFGEDSNGKKNFDISKELPEIENMSWLGREWTVDNLPITLNYNCDAMQLVINYFPLSKL